MAKWKDNILTTGTYKILFCEEYYVCFRKESREMNSLT